MAEMNKQDPEITQEAQQETVQQPPEAEVDKKAAKKHKKELASEIEARLAAADEQMEKAKKKMAEVQNSLLRTAAEYDNYRKRSQKEQEATFGNGVGHAARELLPILDTLDAAANAETKDEEYKKGVLLTLAKCNEIFDKLGIHEIPALGEEFNPELHNAVMQLPAEGAASGTITQVMQKGYTLNDRVIRHAMVAVAP